MPHFSFSKEKTSDFSSLVFHFCFSIFSHPLYFSYFVFFSPYILKLISFLSPLFITTTLLLLALFTVSPNYFVLDANDDSDSKLGFLLSNFQNLVLWLQSKSNQKDEEVGYLEEFEAYLVMFQASIFQALEAKPEENSPQCLDADLVDNNVSVAEVKSLESLFQESEEFEDFGHEKEEKGSGEMKVLESLFREEEKGSQVSDSEQGKSEEETNEKMGQISEFKVRESYTKLDGEGEKKVQESMLEKEENEETKGKIIGLRSGFKVMSKSQRLLEASLGSPENNWVYSESNYLGSFGSMRKEKEWRRTLACKLFEERHNNSSIRGNNINGSESEGMDSLWETYETQSNKAKRSNKKKTMTTLEKSNTKKSTESKYYDPEDEDDEEDEEEEEEGEGIKLCCLQALKFSAGKMNLGMGKPNLMKISKAFKGIGWLHHHVGKHGRKG
ncbi:DNA ligase 1 [Neltuma alba]|uniref:DNA ligase 1 n=1 Tax=Neltuma alba TaxID=207710 RepID=UPI0010A3BCCD|nr:DNA ligase 1 [Prosopis alba]